MVVGVTDLQFFEAEEGKSQHMFQNSNTSAVYYSSSWVHSEGHHSGKVTLIIMSGWSLITRDDFVVSFSFNTPIPWQPSTIDMVPVFLLELASTTSMPGVTPCFTSEINHKGK